MFDRKKYKQFAQIQLKSRRLIPALITLLILGINMLVDIPNQKNSTFFYDKITDNYENMLDMDNMELIQFVAKLSNEAPTGTTITLFTRFFSFIISNILLIASLNLYLKMSRSPQAVHFSDFIEGFNDWGRAVLNGLWVTLWIFLWTLLAIPLFLAAIICTTIISLLIGIVSDTFAIAIIPLLGFVCVIFAATPIIFKAVSYSQSYFLITEFKNLSVKNALKISQKITKNHFWDIFIAHLSFIGWEFLTILTLNILSVWVVPYKNMTFMNVFHALLKEALENGTVKPEDLEPNNLIKIEQETSQKKNDSESAQDESTSNQKEMEVTNDDNQNDTNKDEKTDSADSMDESSTEPVLENTDNEDK